MSDQEPQATPEQQARVRRLLGEARHGEPVPPDVAARLDGVLGQLIAEGPHAIDPPPPARSAAVVDLGARRRRRAAGLLVAAAAVVVAGVGIGRLVTTSSGDDQGDDSSAGGAVESRGRAESGDASPERPPPPQPSEAVPPQSAPPSLDTERELPSITEDSYPRDAQQLQGFPGVVVAAGEMINSTELSAAAAFTCPPTMWGPGTVVAVLYDGLPAVLVYRPPAGETQTVELRQCGSADVLRSTVLPAP